jgi:queuine tRNA-ribosyltransferase
VFEFKTKSIDWLARVGSFKTFHGEIITPTFMPVWTQATIKGITKDQLLQIWSQIILSNTYHLYLSPGEDLIEKFWWIHNFMWVNLPILTDSWWFQVFSLAQTWDKGFKNEASLVKITEDWVAFRSYKDWSKHFFTPEKAMQIQEKIWADIIMAFDECAPGDSTYLYAKKSMELTHRWAVRWLEEHNKLQKTRKTKKKYSQAYFPIIQWVIYDDLRIKSAEFLWWLDTSWIAIGGLSVWESKEDFIRILDLIGPILPKNKIHYLMWLGKPEDLIEWIYRWIDIFDCVLPTRLGRHGIAFSSIWNIRITNEKYKQETWNIPISKWLETYVSKNYSLWYLRHLFHVWEILWWTLLSLHNLEFLLNLTTKARETIIDWKYNEFRKEFWKKYKN